MLSKDVQLQVLHDHYKDTFAVLQVHLKLRDRFFALILLAITTILFQIFSPEGSGEIISQFVMSRLGVNQPIDMSFLGNVLWFSTLALVVRYFQTVVYIERQYDYIHKLEDQINRFVGTKIVTREGKAYLSSYPKFSGWVSIFYGVIFPAFLFLIVLLKGIADISRSESWHLSLIVNLIVSLCITIATALYLLWIHWGK